MKLERLQESILPVVVTVGGLGLALYAGSAAGGGKVGTIFGIIGLIVATAFVLSARERVWMLIPVFWALPGKVSELPLPFTIAQLGVMFAFGVFMILKALKVIRLKPKNDIVEFWIMLVLVYLATVYLRNPVGVEALGSTRVGGRPYFDIMIAAAGLWVLSRSVASPLQASLLPIFVVSAHFFHASINVFANRFPSTVGPLSRVYSGIDAAESLADGGVSAMPEEGGRFTHFQGIGANLFLAAVSYWRPASLINPLRVGRFLVFFLSVFAVLLAGYRSTFMALMAFSLLSSYFRRGSREVIAICILFAVSLSALLLMQGTLFQLPFSAQRALSFLPGKWDYAAKMEAENSTEWRVVMWKTMMTGNKYIENKWLGDGFGFTKQQLQIMAANAQAGSTVDQRENLMINGNVHSGPITTIRYTGYVGLALFLILMGLVARRAFLLIRRADGTPFYACALFIGLPAIFYPASFIFIFGAFDIDLPNVIIMAGMQKMLGNSLDAFSVKPTAAVAPIQPAAKFRRPPQLASTARIN